MSKLEELIKEFCPNGVEYKKIKEWYNRLKGTPITAGKMKEIESSVGNVTIFAGGKTVVVAKEQDIPNANIIRVPAVVVQSRGIIDVIYCNSPFTFKNEMWAYSSKEEIKRFAGLFREVSRSSRRVEEKERERRERRYYRS